MKTTSYYPVLMTGDVAGSSEVLAAEMAYKPGSTVDLEREPLI